MCKNVEGLNLGDTFLQEECGIVDFRHPACLKIDGSSIILRPRDFRLNDNSGDKIFNALSKKLRNVPNSLFYLNLDKLEGKLSQDVLVQDITLFGGVRALHEANLPPESVTVIEVQSRRQECKTAGMLYFTPKNNNSQLNRHSILPWREFILLKGGNF